MTMDEPIFTVSLTLTEARAVMIECACCSYTYKGDPDEDGFCESALRSAGAKLRAAGARLETEDAA